MQAIILAAGMGRRLKDLTKDQTKCMVTVNGVSLIERLLGQLDELHLSRIVIVVGYKADKLMEFVQGLSVKTPIVFVDNKEYASTNNIYSLYLAREYMVEMDSILCESDLIVEDSALKELVDDERPDLALVDKYESWMDGTVVKITPDDRITAVVPKSDFNFADSGEYYKTVNIYKFSKEFSLNQYMPFLKAYIDVFGNNEYYEQVLRVITVFERTGIRVKRLEGQKWYEIDDIQDRDIAEGIFAAGNEKISRMTQRFGGFWRYPRLLDFCYLVNPYFPSDRMTEELDYSFRRLLTQYPSGERVISLLAEKNYNVSADNIVVGNGAAELIKVLLDDETGNIGFIRPTFEEYGNRYAKEKSVVYNVGTPDYRYDANDVLAFFSDKNVDMVVLINPDNPSGNYIEKADVLRLASEFEKKGTRLLVDESFVDFADRQGETLLNEDILNAHPNLIVIKSLSKSYGIPGLRLGLAASADEKRIRLIKDNIPIWNINSFAEYFLQIYEKYQGDYAGALARFREVRNRMKDGLSAIKGDEVLPSQANYFMIKVDAGIINASDLARNLMEKYDILVRDLTNKIDRNDMLRVAIRSEYENEKLIQGIGEIV
ncbi:MAG: aminotransferase class I/II-fold pyridoxal phosphate-dependent enzyme, partial [Eubacterium sp.]|nr:aminotransferase class I/II-fold pyridoxal phosphate-dependent enzyme [Eubacterium sp.]